MCCDRNGILFSCIGMFLLMCFQVTMVSAAPTSRPTATTTSKSQSDKASQTKAKTTDQKKSPTTPKAPAANTKPSTGTDTTPPGGDNFKAPDFKAPSGDNFKAPDFKAPDFKAPAGDNFKAPDFKAPAGGNVKAPDFKASPAGDFKMPATPSGDVTPAPTAKAKPIGKKIDLTILFTNDLYGHLRDFRCRRVGVKGTTYQAADIDFANLLYMVEEERRKAKRRGEPPPLLFNTGDNVATSLTSRFLLRVEQEQGAQFMADVFRQFGYDLIGIGNHEFSVSTERLEPFLRHAYQKGLRFSAANMDATNKQHPLAKYVNQDGKKETKYFIFKRGKLKIGAFHVAPNELEKKVAQRRVKGIAFQNPNDVVGEIITTLRETHQVDMVIALSHMEWRSSKGSVVRKFLQANKGIDLLISNELRSDDTPLSLIIAAPTTGNILAVGGYRYGTHLGKIHLTVQKLSTGGVRKSNVEVKWIPLPKKKFHRDLRKSLLQWEDRYCKQWGSPLGRGRITDKKGMSQEQYIDYLLDLIRYYTRTEVAFLNTKAVKKQYFPLKGYITRDDLFRAIPFNEPIVTFTMKGSELKDLINKYQSPSSSRKKLRFAGINKNEMEGTLTINQRAIEDEGTYTVATIRFIAGGAEGWLETPPKKPKPAYGPNKKPLRLRHMSVDHFKHNRFVELRSISLQTMRAQAAIAIPYKTPVVQLGDRLAWKFKSEFSLNFVSIFVSPINISSFYNQKDTFNSNFFQKFQVSGNIDLQFRADTRMHLWLTKVSLAYDADTSIQYNPDSIASLFPQIYQENSDRILVSTEYHLRYFQARFPGKRRWYFTNPFVEFIVESEFTRGNRPDLSVAQYLRENREIFRHFETRGKAGLSFDIADPLRVKIGFAWQKEWALDLQVQPNNVASVNTEHNIGVSLDYELSSFTLFSIAGHPFKWESRGVYLLTFLVSPNPRQPALDLHDITWDNKLSFPIFRNLEFVVGLRMVVFRGAFRPNTSDPAGTLVSGPWALRITPRVALRYAWDIRGQTF